MWARPHLACELAGFDSLQLAQADFWVAYIGPQLKLGLGAKIFSKIVKIQPKISQNRGFCLWKYPLCFWKSPFWCQNTFLGGLNTYIWTQNSKLQKIWYFFVTQVKSEVNRLREMLSIALQIQMYGI